MDASDGGGNEKRNGNTNVWFAKNVVLPETQDALKVSVEIAGGAKAKLSMYVDGKYVVVIDCVVRGSGNRIPFGQRSDVRI